MSEQKIENVEGDVNVEAEAPAEENTGSESEESPESGDTTGDEAQQDTGALQE